MIIWWFPGRDISASTSKTKPRSQTIQFTWKKIQGWYFSPTTWNFNVFRIGPSEVIGDYVSGEKINLDDVDDFLSVIDHQDMECRIVITLTLFNGSGFMSFYHWKKYKGGPSMNHLKFSYTQNWSLKGDSFVSGDYVSGEKINLDGVDDFLSVIDHRDMKRRIVITLTLFNGSGFMSFYHWKKYKGGPSMRSWWTENIQFLTYVILCLVKKIHLADIS